MSSMFAVREKNWAALVFTLYFGFYKFSDGDLSTTGNC